MAALTSLAAQGLEKAVGREMALGAEGLRPGQVQGLFPHVQVGLVELLPSTVRLVCVVFYVQTGEGGRNPRFGPESPQTGACPWGGHLLGPRRRPVSCPGFAGLISPHVILRVSFPSSQRLVLTGARAVEAIFF